MAISTFEEELVSEITGKKTAGEKARQPLEKQWYQSIAFYLGKQNAEYNPASGELFVPVAPTWRERMIDNKVYPAVRKTFAKKTKNRPVVYVEPNTEEDEDVQAARIGTKLHDYLQVQLELEEKDEDWLLWGDLCGNGYVWLRWNPLLERSIIAQGKKQLAKVGDIEVEVPMPFEIVVDVFGKWVIRSQLLPINYLKEIYPDKADKIKETDEKVAGSHFEKKLLSLIGSEMGAKDYNKSGKSGVGLHLEYYELASAKHPKGRKIVIVSGQLVTDPEQENIYEMLPFVHFSPEMLPGVKNYGTSYMPQIIAPQKSFNRTRSMIKENKKLMIRPKILLPIDANISSEAFTSEAGEKIRYAGSRPPSYLHPPEITTEGTEKDMDRDLRAIEDCTAQHEPTRGQVPQGVKSGVGLAFLVEQDDNTLAPSGRKFERAVAQRGNKLLRMAQKFYREERLLKITGENKKVETFKFIGAQLRDNTDVKVEKDSTLPKSKTAKREEIMEFYKEGLFGDPRHPNTRKKVLKLLEFGKIEEMYEEEGLDADAQKNENEMMIQGQQVNVNPYDNHEIHLLVLDKVIKSPFFATLDPMIKQLFLNHRQMHLMAVMPPMQNAGNPGTKPKAGVPGGIAPPEEVGFPEAGATEGFDNLGM